MSADGATEIFVRNDKGTEYVGSVACDGAAFPPTLTFDDYTRDADVLSGLRWPPQPEWRARLVSLRQTARRPGGSRGVSKGTRVAPACRRRKNQPKRASSRRRFDARDRLRPQRVTATPWRRRGFRGRRVAATPPLRVGSDERRRKRGAGLSTPPRPRRGDSVGDGSRSAVAATWIFHGDGSRRRRGSEQPDRPRRSDAGSATETYGPDSRLRRGSEPDPPRRSDVRESATGPSTPPRPRRGYFRRDGPAGTERDAAAAGPSETPGPAAPTPRVRQRTALPG